MKEYFGSCHCRRVQFKVTTQLDKVVRCNCSICTKKGILHHRVAPGQFTLICGQSSLKLYQFDTKEASHFFCEHCGMHPFSHPRAAPDQYSININCLDNIDFTQITYQVIDFDGKNWENSVAKLNHALDKT